MEGSWDDLERAVGVVPDSHRKMAVFLQNFPTVFVASSARCEEKSSYFGHVKIHRSIPECFLFFF